MSCRRTRWLLVAAIAAAVPLGAQNTRPAGASITPPISDLASENLKHVAASPPDVERILRREPGLMLELKRWLANDAASHGQVISDSDLAEQKVIERLENDTEF